MKSDIRNITNFIIDDLQTKVFLRTKIKQESPFHEK